MREQTHAMRVKLFSVGVGVCVILFMAWIVVNQLYCGSLTYNNTDDAWVMFVTPIASITIITATLLFGAFRRFKESDINNLENKLAKTFTLGNVPGQ